MHLKLHTRFRVIIMVSPPYCNNCKTYFRSKTISRLERKNNQKLIHGTERVNGDCTVNHDSYRLPVSDSNDQACSRQLRPRERKVLCTPANLSRQVYFYQPIDPLTSFDFFTSVVRIAIILQEDTLSRNFSSFQRSSLSLERLGRCCSISRARLLHCL